MTVHGAEWTEKILFVFPNEYVYWSIQIVMYPFTTGLVAGAYMLSMFYYLFEDQKMRVMGRFSLIFSFALLTMASLPLLMHLQQPQRGFNVYFTPHFTSAIAAFGIVYLTYLAVQGSQLWFVHRPFFIRRAEELKTDPTAWGRLQRLVYLALTLGAFEINEATEKFDKKIIKILAAIGIPTLCFFHGYSGFIFGSVKANALWMTPLMAIIFIMSSIVSGTALAMFTYIIMVEWRKLRAQRVHDETGERKILNVEQDVINVVRKYLLIFLFLAFSLEILDIVFKGYTAVQPWEIMRTVIYGKDFFNIFVLQYAMGNFLPIALLVIPNVTVRRMFIACALVLLGVFMMRWNVVIGGQAFSLSLMGFMHYHLPIIPHDLDTFKEGLFGALFVVALPLLSFVAINKFLPAIED